MNCASSYLIKISDFKTLTSELFKEWDELRPQDSVKLEELKDIVEWRKQPAFRRTGRSAFLPLEAPVEISNSKLKIRAIKIKGVGARTHTGQIFQPTSTSVCNNNPHLGFDEFGNFTHIKTAPAPTGGITLNRAVQEFDVSEHLFKYKCPSILPIQVYKYTDPSMRFLSGETGEPDPLGVVITGLPDRSYLRVDSIFYYHYLDATERADLAQWMDLLKITNRSNPALALITALSKLYGKTIRKFSESGLYRYSGAPDNYSYCSDTGEVFLIDLDSSLKLDTLSPQQQTLEVMRDAASGIAYLLAFFTDPRLIQYFPLEAVVEANPFRELLLGYHAGLDPTYIDDISRVIVEYYEEVYRRSLSHQYPLERPEIDSDQGEEAIQKFRSYLSKSYMRPWISRSNTFACLMPICWLLHQDSQIRSDAPVLDKDTLFQNLASYLGDSDDFAIVNRVKRSLSL